MFSKPSLREAQRRSNPVLSVVLDCFASLAMTTFVLVAPAHAESIKIALTKLLSYPSVPIAIERGYFKEQGLDAEMVFFASAEPMAVALASGDVDFGVSGLGAAFYTLAAQGHIRVLASSA